MTAAERFREEAASLISSRTLALRESLTYTTALALPAVTPEDVVVAGKEVLLATYRQVDAPAPEQLLVTVQIARHGLGGVRSFLLEQGIVFSRHEQPRDATEQELQLSENR